MFEFIKFNTEVHELTIKNKRFLCSKNLNFLNQKIGIIPNEIGLDKVLTSLKNQFLRLSDVKDFFYKSVELKVFFNQLITGTFFVYKLREDDDFIFYPKHSHSLRYLGKESFNLKDEIDEKVFLRKINNKWTIDSPSSPFYVAYSEGNKRNLKLSELKSEFSDCLRMDFFSASSMNVMDFKDELFLNEIRKRSDVPKGTMKNKKELKINRIDQFYGDSIKKINLFELSSNIRPNSSRETIQINHQSFLNLLTDLSIIHAVLDDPYLGKINKKTYPSAGSGYGLIPILYVTNVEGLEKGIYTVDERSQSLVSLKLPETHFQASISSFRNSWGGENGEPPLTIQFIFSPTFYYQKYSQTCLALNFLNGGVLISEVYRLAQIHSLGACALGGIDEDLWSEITGREYYSLCEISLCGRK